MGESRTYNNLFQLVTIMAPGISKQYTYPDGANIGKITKQKDVLTGEEVQYTYDSLGRMITAQTTVPGWGYSYVYDGFGNLLDKNVTQGSPSAGLQQTVDANNHVIGQIYDGNGNLYPNLGGNYAAYDVENRLVSVHTANYPEAYGYDPSNKRIYKLQQNQTEEIHFYGVDGRRLGIYQLSTYWNQAFMSQNTISTTTMTLNAYFAGKLVAEAGWTANLIHGIRRSRTG